MPDSYHIPFGRLHNGWLLLYHPHSQYGYLRLIDNRRTEQRLERAEIGNRKRAARYVVRHQLVDARLGSQAVYRNGKPAQVQPVGIMHNGNNQVAVVLRYGYSHIDMFLEQDIVTFYRDVHLRIGNQRFGSRFGNGRHIGQLHPFTFKESLLVFSRHFTNFVISTSTRVVTCGEVCLDITMWSAIIRRTRSISFTSIPSATEVAVTGED